MASNGSPLGDNGDYSRRYVVVCKVEMGWIPVRAHVLCPLTVDQLLTFGFQTFIASDADSNDPSLCDGRLRTPCFISNLTVTIPDDVYVRVWLRKSLRAILVTWYGGLRDYDAPD